MPFTMLLMGVALAFSTYAIIEQGNAAQVACVIQQRGLKANARLSQFFEDWADLTRIQLQQTKTLQQLRGEPAVERALTYRAVSELQAYADIQRQQPKKRSCP
jgi:hypothetical protein